ncbi:MAG: carboxypeptidase-like regulatory domain-containing protein, partial [Sphingobacteriaceae bacterium]|nr:carboxypeptidase-like regulatory domain-containing protein [Sphingobacteriaceae bacterium]
MKRLIALTLLTGLFFNSKAQIPGMGGSAKNIITGRISATIIDSLTKQPIDYASVSLSKIKDGKTINGAVSDQKGKVSIQNIVPGEYNLTIGFIGYKTKKITVKTSPEKPDLNLGTILLFSTESTLQQVEITGKKSIIENKIDRMVYNAEADGTNAGGDATEVMRKVPMLSVDANGDVQLRGSAVRVLINGKPSGTMANSVADALKM